MTDKSLHPQDMHAVQGAVRRGVDGGIRTMLCLAVAIVMTGCFQDQGTSPPQESQPSAAKPVAHDKADAEQAAHHYFHTTEQTHSAEWGYDGELGPAHWADRSPEYVLAKTGKRQSPVDISHAIDKRLPTIVFDYHPAQVDLVYDGHTIKEVEERGSFVELEGVRFELQQFHFHSPSEHTIDGKHFDMEMHLVHKSDEGHVAVVAVLIQQGRNNAAFETIWEYLPTPSNRERKVDTTVDANAMLPQDHAYFRYHGSFTTPPCTEGVLWVVLKTPVELSAAQVAAFRNEIHGNNRPVQLLNGREIEETQ